MRDATDRVLLLRCEAEPTHRSPKSHAGLAGL